MSDMRRVALLVLTVLYVLALLAIIGAVNASLRWFTGFRYAVEVFVLTAVAAVTYVVWLYLRQRLRQNP